MDLHDIELFERDQTRASYLYLRENYSLKELEDYSVLHLIGDLYEKTILDFGCGEGYYSRIFASKLRAKQVVGIDASKSMIRLAKYYTDKSIYPNIDYYHKDGQEKLNLGQFDAVFAAYVLSYAKSKTALKSFVGNLHESLKSGHYCFGLHPNYNFNEYRLDKTMKYGIMRLFPQVLETGSESSVRFFDTKKEDQPLVLEISEYYIKPSDFEEAFHNVGFVQFEWIKPFLKLDHPKYEYYRDAIEYPYSILFKAKKK